MKAAANNYTFIQNAPSNEFSPINSKEFESFKTQKTGIDTDKTPLEKSPQKIQSKKGMDQWEGFIKVGS